MVRERLNELSKEISTVRRRVKASRHVFIDDVQLREAFKQLYRQWDDSASLGIEGCEEQEALAETLWALWEKAENIRTRKTACDQLLGTAERQVKALLRLHRSSGAPHTVPPDFDRVLSDAKLRSNVRARWAEVELCVKHGANIAAVVMVGSIVEAVLLSHCRSDPQAANSAKSTPKVTEKNSGKLKPKPLDQWKFAELIEVAEECGWLSRLEKDTSHILRDWRNLVHPNKQVEQNISVGKRESELLVALCRHLLT